MKCLVVFSLLLVLVNTATNDSSSKEGLKIKGNILCLMPVTSPSHHIWNRTLMKALAKEGYNVTALSVDIDKDPTPNLHYIHLEGVYKATYEGEKPIDFLEVSQFSPVQMLKIYEDFLPMICNYMLKTNGSKVMFQYPRDFKFDLIIFDFTMGPCLLPFIDIFPKAPVLSVTAFYIPTFAADVTGTPLFPSYIPNYSLTYSTKMNFFQRCYNMYMYAMEIYFREKLISNLDISLREYFGPNMKPMKSFDTRSEMLLVNSHPSMQNPEAVTPNIISVGGLQIAQPAALPQDIEKFISSGKQGSVLFSLGTNMKSEFLGNEKIQMFINAISRLPQYNFLWKFEADNLPTLPNNLMIKKWVSQNDILAHPNIKLFLSHCGLLSSQEATWYGVPILGMPFFADQPKNAAKLVEDGVAEQLNVFTITEDEIFQKIKKMLETPSYAQKMKQKSIQFRDRPEHPLDLALFWCKYLIRNGNAQHLRSPAIEMSHFVQHMWDVLVVFLGAVISFILLIRKLFCYLTRRRCSSTKVKTH